MHLVDDIHKVFPLGRRILHRAVDLTDVVHTVVGRRIDLDHVHGGTVLYRPADPALVARAVVHGRFAVDCSGKNLSHGGFAGPSGSAEKISVSDPV